MEGTDNPTGDIETYMRSALSRSLLEMSVQLGAENDEEVTIEYRGVHFAPVVVRSKDP